MITDKLVKFSGAGASCVSILGSYQLCHNICMAAISVLALIGITVTGMPLLFLTSVAPYFWIAGIVLLLTLLLLKSRGMGCITNNSLLFNSGLLIAGIPFYPLNQYQTALWIVGGALVLVSAGFFLYEKWK